LVKFSGENSFLESLEVLGKKASKDVLDALDLIEAQNLTFEEFVEEHGWLEVVLAPENTFPGADPLHWFAIVGAEGDVYQVAAKGPYGALIICSVALLDS
jgi:hypothetical protein